MIAIASLVVGLSGCALLPRTSGADGERPTIATHAQRELGSLAGVGMVSVAQTSLDSGAEPSAVWGDDPLDPDRWSIDLEVTVLLGSTDDEVVAAAEAVADYSESHVGSGPWTARVRVVDLSLTLDPDVEYTPPVRVDVYPETVRRPLGESVRSALAAKELPEVRSVALVDGLPWVQTADAGAMTAVYAGLRESPLWEAGGSLQSTDGRVRIMDVPERQSPAGVDAILAAAAAFPAAQFWLEAPTVGPRWPVLYIDQVSEEEAAAITAIFVAPSMAAANTDTFVLPFTIRATGASGPVDSTGTFGGVPAL